MILFKFTHKEHQYPLLRYPLFKRYHTVHHFCLTFSPCLFSVAFYGYDRIYLKYLPAIHKKVERACKVDIFYLVFKIRFTLLLSSKHCKVHPILCSALMTVIRFTLLLSSKHCKVWGELSEVN